MGILNKIKYFKKEKRELRKDEKWLKYNLKMKNLQI